MTELGKHRLGRHSTAELNPALDDYQLAEALVREAGTLALLMRQAGLEGRQKTSVSDVVTAADHAAEAYVLEQLQRCRPDDGILGEEGASVAGTSGRTWVIDPVDGTYNFLHGSTYWCSAIALKDTSGVQLGAIFQPEEDKLWLGGTDAPLHAQRRAADHLRAGRPSGRRPLQHPVVRTRRRDLHPPHLARGPDVRHALARRRDLRRRAADVRLRLLRPQPGGRRRTGLLVPAQLPGVGLAAGKAIVLAAGGAADVVRVNGLDWFVAGGTTAVRRAPRRPGIRLRG